MKNYVMLTLFLSVHMLTFAQKKKLPEALKKETSKIKIKYKEGAQIVRIEQQKIT